MSQIGKIKINRRDGKTSPVPLIPIQSMLKKPLSCYSEEDFKYFYNLGCDIMRFSIKDETEEDIRRVVNFSPFPLVSDIQGNLSQAIRSMRAGCQGLRLNPANFKEGDLEKIIELAKEKEVCIRIGLNEGSLKDKTDKKILDLTEKYIKFFEKYDFKNLVLSCKSSSFSRTLELNTLLYNNFPYPLHVGLTEAGGEISSSIRTALMLERSILAGEVGTIRFSISSDEDAEIIAARSLLNTLEEVDASLKGCVEGRFNLISCPMCSRAGIDTKGMGSFITKFIFSHYDVRKLNLSFAVLGCGVNGIEEGKSADVGVYPIAKDVFKIFLHGKDFMEARGLEELKSHLRKIFADLISLL